MKIETLNIKNKKTGNRETIKQFCMETDWGFRFFVESEIEAYKAAYEHRNAPHGVIVEFAKGANQWMVTVFNEVAKESGIDGAK